jgi:hypothetical protein
MPFRFVRPVAAVFLMFGLAANAAAAAPAESGLAAWPARYNEQDHALMLAIFGDHYDTGAGRALAIVETEDGDGYFLMTLAGSTELSDGRTVVAVNGHPSNEFGDDAAAHGSPGMLNLYTLRRVGMGWKVIERHEHVASMGSWGDFGSVQWTELGSGKPGFIVVTGWSGQGYSSEAFGIFELGIEVRQLGGMSKASNNGGACMPDTKDCWDVDSSIRFVDSPHGGAYRDMLVDFKGKHYTVTEGKGGADVEHLKSTVQQTARYHFDGNAYVLVSGANPVPGV